MKDGYYSIMGRESFDSHKENLGKVFKGGNIYKIPPNQRDFEWDKSLLEYFWEDLLNSYNRKDITYFFGSTIFEYNDKNNDVIVYDGQQRLATTTILWTVIRDVLWDLKEEEIARTIQGSYISQITEKRHDILNLTLNLFAASISVILVSSSVLCFYYSRIWLKIIGIVPVLLSVIIIGLTIIIQTDFNLS